MDVLVSNYHRTKETGSGLSETYDFKTEKQGSQDHFELFNSSVNGVARIEPLATPLTELLKSSN